MGFENNLDKGTNTKASLPDIGPMLIAGAYQGYPENSQKTNNPRSVEPTPPIIVNPSSESSSLSNSAAKSRSDSTSLSNSAATIGDTTSTSKSSATGGRSNANATGGDATVTGVNSSAKTGDSRSSANGGNGGSSNLYNNYNYTERTAPDVIPAAVIPGAPASTEFEIIDGSRRYKERSNATTDTTNFGLSVGIPPVGVGLTFGTSRPAETEGVKNTAQKENDAFYGVFFPSAVEAADPNLGQATSRLRRDVVQEAQIEQARRAAEAAQKK